MECETARGLLPWLLNGTLAPAEADGVRGHLEGCGPCRAEMGETRQAARVFGAHLPAGDIVDLAWERPLADEGLARRHLADCADCAEELQLAKESRQADRPATVSPIVRAPAARWLALPATLAAGLVVGLLWPRPAAPPAAPPDDGRVASLQAEVGRLRSSLAELEARAAAHAAPEVNLPVFELLSAAVTRGGRDVANAIVVPAGARQVALLLVADGADGRAAHLEARRADGSVAWQADGLRASPLGAYTVAVPVAQLPEGAYVLRLSRPGAPALEYRVRVRR
jgi:putative zinc finger protein